MSGEPPAEAGGDERWHWDGERWQYDAAPEPAAESAPAGEDGQWVWDGTGWRPVAG